MTRVNNTLTAAGLPPLSFGTGSVGIATAVINPEDEISVTLSDGVGRTVATGIITPDGMPVTWRMTRYDVFDPADPAATDHLVETQQVDALGHMTRVRVNGVGSVIEQFDAKGKLTSMKYDANGNQVSSRAPAANANPTTTPVGVDMAYDARNRLISQADTQELFENTSCLTGYDANGNIRTTTDAKGQTATLAYDARDRKVSQSDRLAGVTTWGYDQNGNFLSLCDPDNQAAGKATQWTYDDCNRKLTEIYPDHAPTATPPVNDQKTFTYDMAGRPAVFTDQQGDTVTHTFDAADRLLSRAYHSPSGAQPDDTDTLTYDDARRLLTAQSGRYNNSVTMAYGDGAGRLTQESLTVNFVQARTYTVQSGYDEAGHRTQLTYPDSAVVKRSYNSRDLLEEIKYSDNMVASFTYDDAGRRETRTLGDTPGTVTRWTYGRQDNLVTVIKAPSDTGSVTQLVYDYDANKNKTKEQIAEPSGMVKYGFGTNTAAGYDNEDRLTSWTRDAQSGAQSWRLTAAGDWDYFTDGINGDGIEHKRTHTAVHELRDIAAGTALVYDAKGNLTTNSNAQVYAWDFDNRMRSAAVGGNTHNYTYDALGRRVSKDVMTAGGTGQQSTSVTVFVSDGQQEVAEYAGGADSSHPSRKYVFGDYIDEPEVLVAGSAITAARYYYHQNNLYSTAVLTDQSAAVQERYAYTAYGKPLFCDASGTPLAEQRSVVGNPYLFTGRRLDVETGLFYYRARYYDVDLGRFVCRDPLSYVDSNNLYMYVSDAPLSHRDPTGTRVLADYTCQADLGGHGDLAPLEYPFNSWTPLPIPDIACGSLTATIGPCFPRKPLEYKEAKKGGCAQFRAWVKAHPEFNTALINAAFKTRYSCSASIKCPGPCVDPIEWPVVTGAFPATVDIPVKTIISYLENYGAWEGV